MGASNLLKNNSMDIDSARLDRQNRVNPPDFAPGQGLDNDIEDDIFSDDVSQGNSGSSFGGLGEGQFDSGLGLGSQQGLDSGLGLGIGGLGMQPQQPQKSDEDKFFEGLAKGGKATWNIFKDISSSFGEVTAKYWTHWGSDTIITGLIVSVVGFILGLFGFKYGIEMTVGGLLSCASGVMCLMFNMDNAKTCDSRYKDGSDNGNFSQSSELGSMPMQDDFSTGSDDSLDLNQDSDFDDDLDPYGDDDSDDDDEDYEDPYASDDDSFDFQDTFAEPEKGENTEEAYSQLPELQRGMYTRQFLYEAFTKVLPTLKPDYSTVKSIDEDSDVFIVWEEYLRDAAEATGVKDTNLDSLELVKLEENLFTIKATCTRPVGFKADAVAKELSNIYAYSNGSFNPSVYAKADVVGKRCIITVFTGETALISLKDMYNNCKDFMLDTKNYMPVVIGVDTLGNVVYCDFKKLESILITGMPRSGKSWFVQAVLTQMCALVPPTDLNFYICDPKDGISDFKSFCLPHVKKFVSGDANIVNTLRRIVKEEAPRRKKIIGDAGYVNIWDYKERNPDVHLPIIYVLIDEVVTLAERMDKDTKAEFQGLLVELISQLPALGIRAFLIPHVVKNDIIAKTATDLISCRVSVCGDAGHIESSTGTKPKDFPYKLTNKGDMAVKMTVVSPSTMFVHGPALTSSNVENNDLFDYLRRLWSKYEPLEVADSVASGKEEEKNTNDLLSKLDNDSDTDDLNLFDNEDSNSGSTSLDTFSSNSDEHGLYGLNSSAVQHTEDVGNAGW